MYLKQNMFQFSISKYRLRHLILLTLDTLIIIMSHYISKLIINYSINESILISSSCVFSIINIFMLMIFKCYNSLWNYAVEREIAHIYMAITIGTVPIIVLNNSLGNFFPIQFYIINMVLSITIISSTRVIYRTLRRMLKYESIKYKGMKNGSSKSRVLIVGGGVAGSLIIRELYDNSDMGKIPVAVVDDDKVKHGKKLINIPIVGSTDDIPKIVEEFNIDEIIFSIVNISKFKKREILEKCNQTKCKLKTIPGLFEIIDGKVDIKKIRDIDIEELLGRETVKIDTKGISKYITDKVVLVTGGGGSIGSELCRQISKYNPKTLIILDIYENNAYDIQQELIRKYKNSLDLKVIIASVRDESRLDKIFKVNRPQIVFHAAAHKHVPLMEYSPCEAIKNNVFGTLNVAKISDKYKVERFVLISTDKAVNPTNIMGATKRTAEMIIQTINKESSTEFVAVRFGNVLGSNGSVVPLFKKQIECGGPITVTHEEVCRFFMTIPEAVSLVIQAGAMAKGGEIFVLNMGEPVKIIDLAKNMIRLSGLEPGVDIKIDIQGLRPGEKLYEELLMSEEGLLKTDHDKIFIGKPIDININKLNRNLKLLEKTVKKDDSELVWPIMQNLVTTYIRTSYLPEQYESEIKSELHKELLS